jgi:hypothetical protein
MNLNICRLQHVGGEGSYNGAFTLDVKVLNENLGGILGGTRC